ncbi:3-keto-disaccharide hydrolase [Autumnicola psychrophila]|uniref:DUF1080 domain-containing protein n=1 Tax=Autumnicola psychrophila TaxID=3075592 RepID=A0ABU3DVW1_9FLAO|nr:DUF1080 domain-containing protein [Zunongwangia sp. F225]MDT0687851.1 DUF1080 domain-containing protein [Zunongwangia sp. F225]
MKTPALQLLLMIFITAANGQVSDSESDWIPLFNGENLDGWTVKIAGHPMNENINKTFYAEDSILKVSYEGYKNFDMQFGHIFTDIAYSNYIFRVDYKIIGLGMPDAPHWTNFNSGVMIHAQSPQSMRIEQGFPVSIEGQFLSEGATAGTQTGNAVTPGTNIVMDGKHITEHIINSNSELFPLDTWVRFEVEVHGNKEVIYRVNGKEVMRFAEPQLDDTDNDAKHLLDLGANKSLNQGYIALQAEGQPIWFKNIKIKVLEEH